MPKHKAKRDHKSSSGKSKVARAKRNLRRTKMKIARFKRYLTEEKPVAAGSRRVGWKTDGLERHVNTLQAIIKKG